MRVIAGVCAAFVIAVAVPVLSSGFDHDETWQIGFLHGAAPRTGLGLSTLSLWTWAEGTDDELRRLREDVYEGRQPWCAETTRAPDKMRFLRPLPSLDLALDHALFGVSPRGYHAKQLLLFGALLLAVGVLYRRVGGAGLLPAAALLLFAVGPARTEVVARIATRHLIWAALFGLLALLAHLRYREQGWRRGRWIAPSMLGCGLLCGENALPFVAYLVAYELVLSPRAGSESRVRALAPFALITAGYVAIYAWADLGAQSRGYIDPLREPVRLALEGGERWAGLLLEETLRSPAWQSEFANPWRMAGIPLSLPARLGLAGAVMLGLFALALGLRSHGRNAAVRRHAVWMLVGAAGAMVVVAAGQPGPRLLLVPGIGLTFLIAASIEHAALRARSGLSVSTAAAMITALVTLALYGVLSPLATARLLATHRRVTTAITARWIPPQPLTPAAPSAPGNAGERAENVLVLAAPSTSIPGSPFPSLGRLVVEDTIVGRPSDQRWWYLANNLVDHEVRVTRTGAATLEMELGRARVADPLTRSLWIGCTVDNGARVSLRSMRIEVLEATPQGAPARIRVELDRPLEDPAVRLATWWSGALRPLPLPGVGQSAVLPDAGAPKGGAVRTDH